MPAEPVVLLNESSLFGDWQATVVERKSLPADEALLREIAEASKGSMLPGASLPGIGKLTAVAGQIAGDVASVASRVESTARRLSKINRGQGSLGLLVNDPSLYRRTDSVLAELRSFTADLRANPKKYISVRLF